MKERIDDGIRWYTDESNEDYISVTSLLSLYADKTGLNNWYKRVGKEEADRICNLAIDIGIEAHTYIENYLHSSLTPDIECNSYAKTAIKSFYEHITPYKQEEVIVYNDNRCRYAGRYDQLVAIEENTFLNYTTNTSLEKGIYLCDLKTKRKLPSLTAFYLFKKYFLQASAYYNVLKHEHDIKGAIIVCAGARKARIAYIDKQGLESYFKYYYSLLLNLFEDMPIEIPYKDYNELFYDGLAVYSRGPEELVLL